VTAVEHELLREQAFVDGRWVDADAGETFPVVNPATGEVIAEVPRMGGEETRRALAAAERALPEWKHRTAKDRARVLRRLADLMLEREDALARLMVVEQGKPLAEARVEVAYAASFYEWFGEEAKRVYGDTIPTPWPDKRILVTKEAVGVAAGITPWNFPAAMPTRKSAPALAAGCTVVLKPSEVAPLNAFALADAIHDAGLPPGVFNLVSGHGTVVGEAMATHPDVDMVSFTGSTRAGKRVAELAAHSVKRVALELGGKSASIVLDDADLAAAVRGTVNACFLNSGQTCSAHTRLLVPESRYDEAAKLAVEAAAGFTVGDPFGGSAKLGPLISAVQRERVRDYIRTGIDEGAELLIGGAEAPEGLDKGYYVKPTVFGRVDPHATIAQEEIFGPVLAIITYKDEDDAVRIANDTLYGLAGGVWSKDPEHALSVARRLRTGQVDINGAPFNFLAPFGGFKQSGRGRELGREGLEEYLEYKAIQIKPEAPSV